MEARTIEISLDTAKRWYEQGGELKDMALGAYSIEELIGSKLPKTWDEFCLLNEIKKGEVFIDDISGIVETEIPGNYRDSSDRKNLLPNYEAASQHLAYIQLHQLRNCYRKGWQPNLKDDSDKYGIERFYNPVSRNIELRVVWYDTVSTFLSFPTCELANEFLTNFRGLIEEAGDLI